MQVVPLQAAIELLVAARIAVVPIVARPVRVCPVEGVRIVKAEAYAVALAGIGELAHGVARELRRVVDVVGVRLRRPHGEAVVVLGGDDQVLHPRAFDQAHPLLGVEFHRVEWRHHPQLVLFQGDLLNAHQVLGVSRKGLAVPLAGGARIGAPVNEAAEARLAPPCQTLIARGLGGLPPPLLGLLNCFGIAIVRLRGERRGHQQRQRATS